MSLLSFLAIKKKIQYPTVLNCPKCNTKIDEYYGFCRPCSNKYPFVTGSLQGFPLIDPKQDCCTFKLYGKHHMIQHWFHCRVCDVGVGTGRCLACSISCHTKGHSLEQYYSAFFCDEGYHKHQLQKQQERKKCLIM